MLDISPLTLLLAAGAFLAGGTVKGVLGIGLPLVAVPLLATALDLPTAVALMIVPVTSSNFLQAVQGGRYGAVVRRFWPVLIPLVLFTILSAQFLADIDPRTGALFLGAIVMGFAVVQALPLRLSVPPEWTRLLNPLVGALSGMLGGISNLFGPPVIMYLVALRLPKDEFVATVALFFLVGGVTLYAVLLFKLGNRWAVRGGCGANGCRAFRWQPLAESNRLESVRTSAACRAVPDRHQPCAPRPDVIAAFFFLARAFEVFGGISATQSKDRPTHLRTVLGRRRQPSGNATYSFMGRPL